MTYQILPGTFANKLSLLNFSSKDKDDSERLLQLSLILSYFHQKEMYLLFLKFLLICLVVSLDHIYVCFCVCLEAREELRAFKR